MNNSPVMLVEDNPDDVDLTLRAFSRHGIANEVVVARDGAEALTLLYPTDGSEPLHPAIILLDLNLPLVSGHEVLRRIRADERTALLPVVVLTTSREEQDLVASYRLGANSYVRKPVEFAEFSEAARLLGMYWLILNERPPPTAWEVPRPDDGPGYSSV